MPAWCPYLQQRGNAFSFRITVPADLRAVFGCREVTHALPAHSLLLARERALLLGTQVRALFVQSRHQRCSCEASQQQLASLLKIARQL